MKSDIPMIELKNIELTYDNNKSIFRDLSFSFQKGKFYLLKGESGIGKTSLFRLITRLEEPGKGELRFKNISYLQYDPPELRKKILYIHQTPVSVNGSVMENLIFPFLFKSNRYQKKPGKDQLLSYLAKFRLTDISLEDNAHHLSVGQLQRICFIRGLLLNPDVILLDEPTSALDEESSKIVEQSAENLCTNSSKTVIMISHKPFISEKIVPLLLHLQNGRIKVI